MSATGSRAHQYARAIVEATVERWHTSLGQVAETLARNPDLQQRLADANVAIAQRLSALEQALPGDLPSDVRNFLSTVVQQGDTALLADVAAALDDVAFGRQAQAIKAQIVSAAELSSADQERIRQRILDQHGEGVDFDFQVDPSLLGGLRVRIGDHLVDNSVVSRLNALRETLQTAVR
jgi:F-type H+-transporting ATPase subunit delta